MTYFDYAASSPLLEGVLEIMANAQREDFANPSASHRLGKELLLRIDECRESVLQSLLGRASHGESFLFTSGATESNNQLIRTLVPPVSEIWCHLGDHPSLVEPARWKSKRDKIPLYQIPLAKGGAIDWLVFLEKLKESKCPLILLTFVHNQTGVLFEFEKRTSQLKEVCPRAFVHIDAVQGYGKYALDEGMPFVDSLTISSHKIGGPKGIGGLFVKNLDSLEALLLGGGQEFKKRSSTLPAPLIFGFHEAVKFWLKKRDGEFDRLFALSHRLKEGLTPLAFQVQFPFSQELVSPYILGVVFEGLSSDIVLRILEEKGVIISSSSACSSQLKKKNPALDLLNWDLKKQKSFLRISLGHATTEEHVEHLLLAFRDMVEEVSYLLK